MLIIGANCASGNTSCKIILEFAFKKSQIVIKMYGCFEITRPVLAARPLEECFYTLLPLLSRMGLEGSYFLPVLSQLLVTLPHSLLPCPSRS